MTQQSCAEKMDDFASENIGAESSVSGLQDSEQRYVLARPTWYHNLGLAALACVSSVGGSAYDGNLNCTSPAIFSQDFDYTKSYDLEAITARLTIKSFLKSIDEISAKIKSIIGDEGVRRFSSFAQYSEGWNMGKGKPLSKQSIAQMERFLRSAENLIPVEPSIFLEESGNLLLQWEDANDEEVSISFYPDHFEYYIGATDDEGEFISTELDQLIEKLR